MPDAWSDKRERQYEAIKESLMESGKKEERAKEIAARTVNKQRRENGETLSGKKRTEGTGNPHSRLEERTRDELYNRAAQLHIQGRSSMTKEELIAAIREANG